MLSHDKQGYPVDWTAEAEYEPNTTLYGLEVCINPAVIEIEFQQMIQRAALSEEQRQTLAASLTVENIRERTYQSYWGLGGLSEADCYGPMAQLQIQDLRRLIHPEYSRVQGLHITERNAKGQGEEL